MKDNSKVGVLIGRYQIDELHAGHIKCIQEVRANHDRVIILVGERDTPATDTNPLPFFIRKEMLEDEQGVGPVEVYPIMDHPSDEVWSKNVDTLIRNVAGGFGAVLYSGREGFISHYLGNYHCVELKCGMDEISATELRKHIAQHPMHSQEFRAGMIYQMQHLMSRTYETVDIAMLKAAGTMPMHCELLLARKPGEKLFRLPGGFANMNEPLEKAARREMSEETGLVFESPLTLLGDHLINDWRIRDTKRVSCRTFLFAGWYSFGTPCADDDIEEVKWVRIGELMQRPNKIIVSEHRGLILAVIDYILSESGIAAANACRSTTTKSIT